MSKNIVLGVSGGIAAYKALDIVSKLKKKDVNVDVIMTKSSLEFVTELSFQSLSQNPVITDMFQEPKVWEIAHISLSKKADVLLVAPATANIIGKVANGIADDMLSTTIMACTKTVVFAPAMNTNMYNNPIVKENITKLKSLGYIFIEPQEGRLACGDTGKGKLEDTEIIVDKVMSILEDTNNNRSNNSFNEISSESFESKPEYYQNLESKTELKKDLEGKKIIITAGPTSVPIDPVRLLTNRSSGKMGYALAKIAKDRGANVVLISGTNALVDIEGIKTVHILTNDEMYNEILKEFDSSDAIIMAAAVADYKSVSYSNDKIKKTDSDLTLTFTRDRDILKTLGSIKKNQKLIGFAAESNNHEENAIKKLNSKNADLIVMNDISNSKVFGQENTSITIFSNNKSTHFEGSKLNASNAILDELKILFEKESK